MGFLSSVAGSLSDLGSDLVGGVSGIFGEAEDLLNDKAFQQVAAAALGSFGGPAGAMAAQQTVASVQQGRLEDKAAAAQKKQRAIRRRQANVAAVRRRASALRERRMAQAQTEAQGQFAGALSSSAVAGSQASTSMQAASNLQIISSNQAAQNQMFDLAAEIGSAQTESARLGAMADIGSTVFTYQQNRPKSSR